MTRFFSALVIALTAFAVAFYREGMATPAQLIRVLDQPGIIPGSAWVAGVLGFLAAIIVPFLVSAARQAVPTARRSGATPAKAADPTTSGRPDLALPKALPEENPVLCVALSALTLFVVRFFTVPQGWMYTITAFGKYRRLVPPGLGRCLSLWGLFERVGMAVPEMEQIDTFDREAVFTSDGVNCLIDVMVCYKVVNPEAAVYQVSDYREAIRQLVQAVLRNECGKRSTRNLLSGREEMAENLKQNLAQDVEPWGITVRLVEITNIQIPKEAK